MTLFDLRSSQSKFKGAYVNLNHRLWLPVCLYFTWSREGTTIIWKFNPSTIQKSYEKGMLVTILKVKLELFTTCIKPAVNDALFFFNRPLPSNLSCHFPIPLPVLPHSIILLKKKYFYNKLVTFILIFNQSGAAYPFISCLNLPLIICLCNHLRLWYSHSYNMSCIDSISCS